jgi:hypothetical protein
MNNYIRKARVGVRLVCGAAVGLGAPALADHMGPGSVGSGGGLSVVSPDTLDEGHAALGFRLTYTRPERRSDTELADLSDRGIDAHNTDYNLNASIGAAYGVTHHLTVSAELPYVRRERLRAAEGGTVERLGTVSGIGDLNLLAKYRVPTGAGASFALFGGIKVPTGSTGKRGPGGERLETEHQPGTGSWDPIAGAAFGAKVGPVALSMGALYQWSTQGAQRTRLGDRLQGGIAVSHQFSGAPPMHHDGPNHHHGDELDEHADDAHRASWDAFVELTGEWEGRQAIAGEVEQASGGAAIWLAPGVRFITASGLSLAASAGAPLWQHIRKSHPDNKLRLTIAVGKAF